MLYPLASNGNGPRRSGLLLRRRRQDLPRWHLERLGQLPHGPQRDRPTRFDALVVPQAKAKLHHVLLGEVASFPQGAHMAPERPAEA